MRKREIVKIPLTITSFKRGTYRDFLSLLGSLVEIINDLAYPKKLITLRVGRAKGSRRKVVIMAARPGTSSKYFAPDIQRYIKKGSYVQTY